MTATVANGQIKVNQSGRSKTAEPGGFFNQCCFGTVFGGGDCSCNAGDTAAYTAALQSGTLPPGTAEKLDPATRRTELLGLLLRTDEGLPPAMLRPQDEAFITMLQNEGLATLTPAGRLLLTCAGRLVADEIAVGLI